MNHRWKRRQRTLHRCELTALCTALLDTTNSVKNRKDPFGRSLIRLPAPRLVVFYNGLENKPKEENVPVTMNIKVQISEG